MEIIKIILVALAIIYGSATLLTFVIMIKDQDKLDEEADEIDPND